MPDNTQASSNRQIKDTFNYLENGLVPFSVAAGVTRFLREDATWVIPTGSNPYTIIIKSADQTINNSTVLVDDTDLQFPVIANTKYFFSMIIFYTTAPLADFKYRITGPTGASFVAIRREANSPGASSSTAQGVDGAFHTSDILVLGAGSLTEPGAIMIDGVAHIGATAGDIKFTWAQNTAIPLNTTVKASCKLEYLEGI